MTTKQTKTPPAASSLKKAPKAAPEEQGREPFFVMQDSWVDALQLVDPDTRWRLLTYARDYQLHDREPEISDPQVDIAYFFMKSEHNEETSGRRQDHFLLRQSWLGMFELLSDEARWELMEHIGCYQLTGQSPETMRPELQTVYYLLREAIKEDISGCGDVFIIRKPWMDAMQKLPTSKRWYLTQYVMRYQRLGEEPDIEDLEIRMAFVFIREELARLAKAEGLPASPAA